MPRERVQRGHQELLAQARGSAAPVMGRVGQGRWLGEGPLSKAFAVPAECRGAEGRMAEPVDTIWQRFDASSKPLALTGVDATPVRRSMGQEKGPARRLRRGVFAVPADLAGAATEKGAGVRDGMGLSGGGESDRPSVSVVEAGELVSGKLGLCRSARNARVFAVNAPAENAKGRERCEPVKAVKAKRKNVWDWMAGGDWRIDGVRHGDRLAGSSARALTVVRPANEWAKSGRGGEQGELGETRGGGGACSGRTRDEVMGRVTGGAQEGALLRVTGRGASGSDPPHLPGGAPDRSVRMGTPVQDCTAHYSTGCHKTQFPVKGGNGGCLKGWNWESIAAVEGVNAKCTISNGTKDNDQSEQDPEKGIIKQGVAIEGERVDDRSRIENLLLISGVERNPGPGNERDLMMTLTHENLLWVFDAAIWSSKTDKYRDRTRALLKQFKPGSVAHRRIARMASEMAETRGEGATDQSQWAALVKCIRDSLPNTPLSQQDHLARMSRRSDEAWVEFMDRYLMYAATCDSVSEQVKTAELYRKLPRELRIQLGHLPHDASLEDLLNALRTVRYWAHCARDKTVLFDPMEVGAHIEQPPQHLSRDSVVNDPLEDYVLRQGDGRYKRPVLRGDTIHFQNIDGPRSLMTAWKKLVSTSPSLRREAQDFLVRNRPHKGLREAAVERNDKLDSVQDDFAVDDVPLWSEDFGHIQDEFTDGEADFWGDSFYECESNPNEACHQFETQIGNETEDVEELFYDCDTSPDEKCHQVLALPALCRSAQKKSLHVKVNIEGTDILALVDTGATSSFVQAAVVKRLGLWDSVQPCNQDVRYGNGDVEPMIGMVTLPVKVQGADMPMQAFVLKSKGPPLIMGFPFLEDNKLVVDCTARKLTKKDGQGHVKCLPVQTSGATPPLHRPPPSHLDALVVQRFPVEGHFPPCPTKKFSGDAAYDFFAPTEICLRPGERRTVDTGVACQFPPSTWFLLKEKSGLAHRYGLQLLGGVIDGNYRGRLKAILLNTGPTAVTIPRHAAFCQGILLPCSSTRVVSGTVRVEGERGATGGVNRVLSGNGGRRGLGAAVGRG